MSSGGGEGGWFGVCEQGSVDDVGEFAFEESDGFSFGVAGGESFLNEGLSVGMDTHLGDSYAMQGGVGLTVPAPVEAEPVRVG